MFGFRAQGFRLWRLHAPNKGGHPEALNPTQLQPATCQCDLAEIAAPKIGEMNTGTRIVIGTRTRGA